MLIYHVSEPSLEMANLVLTEKYGDKFGRLYIGDMWDRLAATQMDVIINVLEDPDPTEQFDREFVVPIASVGIDGQIHANHNALNRVAEAIHKNMKAGKKVMVHCAAGQERSPLAVVWFLHTKRGMDLEAAYDMVRSKRPQTMDCLDWL